MIFAPELYCACTKTVELDGLSPAELGGDGLWVGVLSRGACALQGCERPGRSGDILLGGGPLTLTPQTDCHLVAVRLTGRCAEAYLLRLGAPRWADGAACPGAAELAAQLHGGASAPLAYALLCAVAKADETARALPPLVREAVTAMQQNYMALYGMEELSEHLGVTKSHLVRAFKQAMGITPGKYLTAVRIEAVKTLLMSGEYNLDTIAGLPARARTTCAASSSGRKASAPPSGGRPPRRCPPPPNCPRAARRCSCKKAPAGPARKDRRSRDGCAGLSVYCFAYSAVL